MLQGCYPQKHAQHTEPDRSRLLILFHRSNVKFIHSSLRCSHHFQANWAHLIFTDKAYQKRKVFLQPVKPVWLVSSGCLVCSLDLPLRTKLKVPFGPPSEFSHPLNSVTCLV